MSGITQEDALQRDDEPTSPGEPLPPKRPGSRRRIPVPSIVNFTALVLLFTAIFMLQHFGHRLRTAPAAKSTSAVAKAAWKSIPGIENSQAAVAEVQPAPLASAGTEAVAEAKPAPAPIEASPEAPEASVPERLEVALPNTKADDGVKAHADVKPQLKTTARTEPRVSFDSVKLGVLKDVPVEELDGENVRQKYLAANKSKDAALAAHEPEAKAPSADMEPKPALTKPAQTRPDAPSKAQSGDLFIPFEKRR